MKILIDENNNIIAYASVGDIPNVDGSTELNVDIPNELIEEQYEEEQEDGSLSIITIVKDLTNYKYINGEFIPNGKERAEEIQIEIATLKQRLVNSDYMAIKYAEGFITESDYTDIRNQRQAIRDGINKLEGELEAYKRTCELLEYEEEEERARPTAASTMTRI